MAQILAIIFGIPFITFVPGFSLSYVFFRKDDISIWTRVLLSFILTIISLPLLTYTGTLFGLKLNFVSILAMVAIIVLFSAILVQMRNRIKHGN